MITAVVGVERELGVRLWGIHILCICGDGVLPKVTLDPIDSHKTMYPLDIKVNNDHHGDLLPLGQLECPSWGATTPWGKVQHGGAITP